MVIVKTEYIKSSINEGLDVFLDKGGVLNNVIINVRLNDRYEYLFSLRFEGYNGNNVLRYQSKDSMIRSIENMEEQLAEIKAYLKGNNV